MNIRKLATRQLSDDDHGIAVLLHRDPGRGSGPGAAPIDEGSRRLPEILSGNEIERIFGVTNNVKHRVFLMTTYAGGLRVSEVVHLKVTDIHSDRMMIRVGQGKGRKDRYTLLSERLLGELADLLEAQASGSVAVPGPVQPPDDRRRMAHHIYVHGRQEGWRAAKAASTSCVTALPRICWSPVWTAHHPSAAGPQFAADDGALLQVTSKTLQGTRSPLDLIAVPTSPSPAGMIDAADRHMQGGACSDHETAL